MSKQLPNLADTLFNLATHAQGLSVALDDLHANIKAGVVTDAETLPETQRMLVMLSHHVTEAAAYLYGPIDQAARELRIQEAEAKRIRGMK